MEAIRLYNPGETSQEVSVGDTVTIDQKDWTVAEIVSSKIVLYREGIDGRSVTMEVTSNELSELTHR